MLDDALECFWKLKNIIQYDPLTLYQIGHVYHLSGDVEQASEWYIFYYYLFRNYVLIIKFLWLFILT